MRTAALVSWLVTAGLGAFMLRTWLARGGLRAERAKTGGLPPQLIFGHALAAFAGLLSWAAYLLTGERAIAWSGVVLLMATVSLGLCTVTLWTPYPARKPGQRGAAGHWEAPASAVPGTSIPDTGIPDTGIPGTGAAAAEEAHLGSRPDDPAAFEVTDEMIARLLEDSHRAPRPRPIRPNPAVLVPIAHGFAAIATFTLAVMGAVS
ncbi:MAG TPA: hypothetical protein VHF26_25090 [Trebonia sp.]|nr:hypothetical protein [Trebonia sp.]